MTLGSRDVAVAGCFNLRALYYACQVKRYRSHMYCVVLEAFLVLCETDNRVGV